MFRVLSLKFQSVRDNHIQWNIKIILKIVKLQILQLMVETTKFHNWKTDWNQKNTIFDFLTKQLLGIK